MSAALAPVTRLLASPEWLGGSWVPEQRAVADLFLENLRVGLSSLRPQAAVRASFASIRSAYPLVEVSQLSTVCRFALVLLVREMYREAEHVSGSLPDEAGTLIRFAKQIAALPATLGVTGDPPTGVTRDAILSRIRTQIGRARDEINGPVVGTFVDTFLTHARQSLSILAARGASPEILLHNAASRADRAASDVSADWAKLSHETRLAYAERAVVELSGAIAIGAITHHEGRLDDDIARAWASDIASRALVAVVSWPDEAISENFVQASDTTHFAPESPMNTSSAPASISAQSPAPSKTTQVLNTLQNDAIDAAWRTAGSQFVKLARDPLVALISRHLAPDDDSMRMKVALFLQTEVGAALLASVLSIGLSAVPASSGPAPARLARELRVKAMADVGDLVAEVIMGPLRQVMSLYLQDVGGMVSSVTPNLPDAASTPELNAGLSSSIPGQTRVESNTGNGRS